MGSKLSSETSRLPMSTLRTGFACYCRLLGLKKDTCLALTLLLNSEQLLIAMLFFLKRKDEERIQEVMDQEDITTMVVRKAEELIEIWDKMQEKT